MGGDYGPSVTVPAALQALEQHADLKIILVGDEHVLKDELNKVSSANLSRLQVHHASEKVEMDELPAQALRNKKDSSMRVALNLVKLGKAEACVSAGNTGALMATARFVLKTLPGIDRPAIISTFPTMNPSKSVRMLDLGANVDSTVEQLAQFAVMGSLLAQVLDDIQNPRVSLLNIGEEEIKGNEQVRNTAQLLMKLPLINYVGYIEGDAIYTGETDVVVCDGFVGNITLKTTEGVALYIGKLIKEAFSRNFLTKIAALIALPVLKACIKRIDPAQYNGATFIGLNATVIKSHGGASIKGFKHAIQEAVLNVKNNVPLRLKEAIEFSHHQLNQDTSS